MLRVCGVANADALGDQWDLLGHSDITSTLVYVHTTPAELRAAVRELQE